MSAGILMPASGHVIRWLKRPGDWVLQTEPVVIVGIANRPTVLRAPSPGLLTAVFARSGQSAAPGEDLAYVERAIAGPSGKVVPWTEERRKIAEHMQLSSSRAAHIMTTVEVDLSRLEALRNELKERGVPLSLTPFFVRAAGEGLLDWPCLNAQVTAAGLAIPDAVHVAVPIPIPGSVYLVVLRDVPQKGVARLGAELKQLSLRARAGQLPPLVSDSATFTITNPGALGSVGGTQVIAQPNCAIMACHAVVNRPVAVEGTRIEVRPMMNLSLSFDHRVLDGVMTLGFLNRVKEVLETAQLPI